MKRSLLCLSGVLLLIFSSLNVQASIYEIIQPPHSTPGGLVSSPLDPYGDPGARVYDDFTLSSPYYISGITWYGIYYPLPSSQLDFTVSFYKDSGGSPGDLYASYAYDVTGQSGNIVYSYPGALGTSFDTGKYWLSIYNNTSNSSFAWQYAATSYGNGSIQSPVLGVPSDVAFTLTFTTSQPPVPIPPAAWLFASGLIALVAIRRRMRRG